MIYEFAMHSQPGRLDFRPLRSYWGVAMGTIAPLGVRKVVVSRIL